MLKNLKRLLGISDDSKDEILTLLLAAAEQTALGIMHRNTLPPQAGGVVVEMAVIAYNRLGTEGETARREGGISHSFVDMPEGIRRQLARYAKARVIGA